MTKPFRTFPVLQRLTVDDFDYVRERMVDKTMPHKAPWYEHTLQLGGQVIFRLPAIFTDWGAEEVKTVFQWMLDHRANGVFIGYDEGKKAIQRELRTLLAVAASPADMTKGYHRDQDANGHQSG